MMDIYQYCKVLGVKPGDSPEVVKSAFREKIKECHPDKGGDLEKARILIEAYEKLKNGVPQIQVKQSGEKSKINKVVFQEFLSRIFANDPHILNIINEVLNSYGLEEIDFPFKVKKYYKENQEYHSKKGLEEFERAEKYFHYSMEKFNSEKNRPIRYRSLELIKNLSQVQIIYRSVMRRHPSFTLKCKKRLEQIQELMNHAKLVL